MSDGNSKNEPARHYRRSDEWIDRRIERLMAREAHAKKVAAAIEKLKEQSDAEEDDEET
jgi:hypothetical protein